MPRRSLGDRDAMTEFRERTAADAGTVSLGPHLVVSRLGFDAMHISGEHAWGEPNDRDGTLAV